MENCKGLSAEQVKALAKEYGYNQITEKKRVTLWQKYWQNFNDPIIVILLVALGINVIFTFWGKVDYFECVGILIAVIIATLVSTISEYKNENTFQKLQKEALKIMCKVYRDGELTEVPIDKLVVGDMVLLQSGDLVPADGHLASGSISVDQSSLNGESKEVEKTGGEIKSSLRRIVDFWDRHSVYRGSVVCGGQGIMKVGAVGDATLYGRLTIEAQESDRKSPLHIKLGRLAKDISRFGYIGAFLVFAMFIFQKGFADNSFDMVLISRYFADIPQLTSDIVEGIIMCVTVIVVAVPEGLPLMIAIVCSLNMRKMLKSNVLVRKIVGIETAGSINILFTDKTGTLTKGNLSVTDFVDGDNCVYPLPKDIPEKLRKILAVSILGNTAATISGKRIIGGNSTEKALAEYVKGFGERVNFEKVKEQPFDSENKFSASQIRGDINKTLIKGAPEKILPLCERYLDKNGNIKEFNIKTNIEKRIEAYAENTGRIIAFAMYDGDMKKVLPQNMIFVGFAVIKDEIRTNVRSAAEEVMRAGIQIVMITGDRADTASAIARECGILRQNSDLVITSEELHMMGDTELRGLLPRIRVVARALPEDKSRLVRVAQSCTMVVGMTGDGVNDSPALKSADVGFAMGSGSEVAKESGDIVIMDDDFSSVKKAVLYGRTIYKSIKKFISFQLAINVAAVSVSVIGLFVGVKKPLSITQMLWVNLVMDTLAAIAFGGEPALQRYMLEKPKSRDDAILDRRMWSSVLTEGFFICIVSIIMFLSEDIHLIFRSDMGDICFYTGYFSFFVFAAIFNAFNARTEGIDLFENLAANKQFITVMGAVALVQLLMTYFGGSFLRTTGLNIREWLLVMGLAVLIIPVDLIRKLITK